MRPTVLSLITILSIIIPCDISAAEPDTTDTLRPVTSAYSLSAGGAEVADTYLSPLIYRGWNVGFYYERLQAMKFSPENWIMQLSIGLNASHSENPAGNADMWQSNIDASWAMMRRWKLPYKFIVGVGGNTQLNIGAIYNPRNGNNPASAKAAWTIGVRAYATYPVKWKNFNALLRWTGTMPVTGIFFSPQYGELYYEIWMGNHSGLVRGVWWGNYMAIDNEFDLDISIGSTWLRLGYRSNIMSTKASEITTRIIYNSFVLGITTEWISIKANNLPSKNARIISALY